MAAGSTYTPIATTTLSSANNSVTFSSIPSTYTDLRVVIANATCTATDQNILFRVGNSSVDSGSNYSCTNLGARALSTTPFSARQSSQTYGYSNWYTAIGTSYAGMAQIDFMNYSNTSTYKTVISSARVNEGNGTYSGVEDIVNLWRSTSAINIITFYCGSSSYQFGTGSTFTLYGIAAA